MWFIHNFSKVLFLQYKKIRGLDSVGVENNKLRRTNIPLYL